MNKLLLFATCAVVSFSYGINFAQAAGSNSAKTIGDIEVEIIEEVKVRQVKPMIFGAYLGEIGGVVTLNPSNSAISGDGAAFNVKINSVTPQAAEFSITGTEGIRFQVNFSNATVNNSGSSMKVNNYQIDYNGAKSISEDLILTSGATLKVGADLTIGAKQPVGKYSGTYLVTVSY